MRNTDIDIGLSALTLHAVRGQTLTERDIADVCNCSRSYIFELEKKALKKIRTNPLLKTIAEERD